MSTSTSTGTRRQRSAPAADQDTTAEQDAGEPTPRWWRFIGPYPLVLVDRARVVEHGEVVEWPAGPPDLEHWQPAAPPTDNTGDAGSEES